MSRVSLPAAGSRRATADVPGAHPRPRRTGRRDGRRAALGRRVRRGPPRAGLPELRLRAHRCARRRLLPHRRRADPRARADRRARCADRPGPDAPAPGRRVRRARARTATSSSTPPAASTSSGSASSSERFRPERAADGSRHRPRARAPRAARSRTPCCSAGFAALSGLVSLDSVDAAIRERFPGTIGERQRGRGARPRSSSSRPSWGSWPMLKQIEGSQAVAEAVALCRPEVICAYPISPQTHIVEALSDMVRTGELAPCEYLNVESEFAAMSVCIGASATGARTYTATASQGLLYMAEALYNASGLGLPIVMTVANRAIGAPINIWNDHSDSMSQRDSGWIQLYAETNQEALDLHIQAYRLAEELSLPVMVCMDGFILTHAYERVDVPEPGAGRRVPAAVRAAPGARPRRAGDDRRDGRPRGVHRGQVPDARQADAGARPDPRGSRPSSSRRSGGTRAGFCAATAPRTPRRSSSRSARCSGRSRTWSTSCATRASGSARSASSASGPTRSRRSARRSAARRGWWCSRRRSRSAPAGSSARTSGWRSPDRPPPSTTSSPASAGGRSPSARCTGCSPTPSRTGWLRSD